MALVLALLTIASIVCAILYSTREARALRRGQTLGERRRRRRNAERIEAKQKAMTGEA